MSNTTTQTIGSVVMIDLPEFQSDHTTGRSALILGSPDNNGYVPIVPFSTQEDWNHQGLNLYPSGIGGRDTDGYLMIAHQGYCHVSRIYRSLGRFTKRWIELAYDDLESTPNKILPRTYRPLG